MRKQTLRRIDNRRRVAVKQSAATIFQTAQTILTLADAKRRAAARY